MSLWTPERLGRHLARVHHRHPYLEVPDGWELLHAGGPWPFLTHLRWRRPDGTEVTWRSRAHRKAPTAEVPRWWFAPGQLGWWIGVLFAIGSACFLVASLPGAAEAMGPSTQGVTYFVGSIFFTSAAFAQYLQTQSAGIDPGSPAARRRGHRLAAEPRRIDWWAASVQLWGTILFNRNCWFAMQDGLSATEEARLVWVPDALGCICFLVASWLAWAEVCEGSWTWHPRVVGWWIAGLNLVGSIAFAVSAVGAFVLPDGDALADGLAVGGTAIGAACFLVGAVLLLPELRAAPLYTGDDALPPEVAVAPAG